MQSGIANRCFGILPIRQKHLEFLPTDARMFCQRVIRLAPSRTRDAANPGDGVLSD
jgi:hypothetical protein